MGRIILTVTATDADTGERFFSTSALGDVVQTGELVNAVLGATEHLRRSHPATGERPGTGAVEWTEEPAPAELEQPEPGDADHS